LNNDWLYNGGITPFGIGTRQYDGIQSIHKFGYNGNITTAEELIWDFGDSSSVSAMTYQDAGVTTYIGTQLDDATARGKTFVVHGLDDDFALQKEEVTLDATDSRVAVTLANQYRRIYRVYLKDGQAPLTGVAGGAYVFLTDTKSGGAPDVVSVLMANCMAFVNCDQGSPGNFNQTNFAGFTVPAGYTGIILGLFAQATLTGPADHIYLKLRSRTATTAHASTEWRTRDFCKIHEGWFKKLLDGCCPIATIGEKEDVEMVCATDAGNAEISGQFSIILVSDAQWGTGGITNL